jgi:hypothetical protein
MAVLVTFPPGQVASGRPAPERPVPFHGEGLHLHGIAVYLRAMVERDQNPRPRLSLPDLLEFRPWMLALAVFLACAIGIAIMEQVRDTRDVWAQVTAQDAAATQRP